MIFHPAGKSAGVRELLHASRLREGLARTVAYYREHLSRYLDA